MWSVIHSFGGDLFKKMVMIGYIDFFVSHITGGEREKLLRNKDHSTGHLIMF